TGVMRVFGAGGGEFFALQEDGTYRSPDYEFGTLVQNQDESYTYTSKDQVRWDFDGYGYLIHVVDPHDLAVTFSYDPDTSKLVGIDFPDGSHTTFTYDPDTDLLTEIDEPGNRVVTFNYDVYGFAGITNPDGGQAWPLKVTF